MWRLEIEAPFGEHLRVRRYALDNGLRAVLLVDRAAPIVSYQTWFRVGSRHEEPGRTGMAHLFEHLMFNQTSTLPQGEFDKLIERTGGETNAATWVDWTYYRDTVPARDLPLAIRLEADRMQNLMLEHEQLESEREVVANERIQRVDDDVDGFLDEQLYKLAFQVHPYHWPTIGWMEDIRAIARQDVHRFYRTFYAPNCATLVIVGDFDEAEALAECARHYGDIAPAELPDAPAAIEPPQIAERRAAFARPVSADRLLVGYRSPGMGHADWPALHIIGELLAGGPSARLYRRLVIERELATSVDSHVAPFRDPALMQLAVNLVRGQRAAAAEAELYAAIARLSAEPVPEAELAKVKNCVETDFWSSLEDVDGKAESLGQYESTLGDFRRLFDMAERIRAVDPDDVMRVASEYLVPARRTAVVAEPDGDAPDGDEVPC